MIMLAFSTVITLDIYKKNLQIQKVKQKINFSTLCKYMANAKTNTVLENQITILVQKQILEWKNI